VTICVSVLLQICSHDVFVLCRLALVVTVGAFIHLLILSLKYLFITIIILTAGGVCSHYH